MLDRIKHGVAIGLVFACLYSGYVGILYLLRGSEPFSRLGTTVLVVIASYFAGGISGGAVVGILQPLGRSLLGAIFVGIVAACFVFLGIGVAADGPPSHWDDVAWISWSGCALVFGVIGGYRFWTHPM